MRGAAVVLAALALGACTGAGGAGKASDREAVTGGLPGTQAFPPELLERFEARASEMGPDYRPRTRHLRPDGRAKYTNRLFLSSSPYLLQHAHNPVNWYPWGDEAFETAKRLGRPVLLSVGYSTCHWCHVMEEESFEDEPIARLMNETYVAIKVDREERPDVDAIYMSAVQTLTGSGGWPMTVWLTPDRKPYYGGTYFPARDGARGARIGFLTLLQRLRAFYDEQPERVAQSAEQLVQAIRQGLAPPAGGDGLPGADVLRSAAALYRARFDPTHGGLQGAPKFPSSLPVRFLMRYQRRTGDEKALGMSALTLEKMAAGGIYDQVGGGFHRYSTDARWLVPHFEKMLYDNALLAVAYLEGYQATGREDFARVAREILRYVERDMTSPQSAFYSATDADSQTPGGHREEGYFFTWTPAEIEKTLGKDRARIVSTCYGVAEQGNFEGRNILHLPRPLPEVARNLRIGPPRLRTILEEARESLYRARAERPAPLRDEKILAAWNGLMISGYARAALVLGEEGYARTATRAADFVLRNLRKNGRLLRSYKDGRPLHNAYLDDYAFLTAGLLDLFEATGERRWLEEAIALDAVLEAQYEDRPGGGFFMTSADHEDLLAREKPAYDGAEPSGNSVAVLNLLRLHELTTDDRYRRRAERALKAFEPVLERAPSALSEMLLAVDFHLDTPKEIIIVTPSRPDRAGPLLAELRRAFIPNRVLVVVPEGEPLTALSRVVPLVQGKIARDGKATAYVCESRVCELPTTDPEIFAQQIRKVRSLAVPKRQNEGS
ncbi:MAG: thioredoxin domain-containing protein [Acidobacteria bacterium]|nr:thioredoxin domain-containing protein [Acidobacteriota bacterium]